MATLQTVATRVTGTNFPAGKAYFETSTNKFIVWNGESWIELHSDGVGVLDPYNIDIVDTEANILARTGDPEGTIARVTDSSKLYVYEGGAWYVFNYDPFNQYALSFDGNQQNLKIPTSTSLMSGDFTTSFWVNLSQDGDSSDGAFLDNNYDIGTNPNTFGWRLYFNSESSNNTGSMSVWAKNESGQYDNPLANVSVTLGVNSWSHIMWGRASGNHFLRVNGQVITTSAGSSRAFNSDSYNFTPSGSDLRLFILHGQANTLAPQGMIDDLAIWSSDQSSNLSDIYNEGTPSDILHYYPDGYWRMGDDSNDSPVVGGAVSTVTDSSGNGNHATGDIGNEPIFFKHA